MNLSRATAVLCIAGTAIAAGCSAHDRVAREHSDRRADRVPRDSGSAAEARTATLQPGALKTVASAPVRGWTGPGNQPFEVALRTSAHQSGHARRFGSVTLQTALHARPLEQYPCTSCHLGRKLVMAGKRAADAHQDIRPVHPEQTGARCSTCHASEDVEQLTLESGERATLDATYRLCAQCHFRQTDAWAQGAHGKRLDGWQGRRVVMGCADCHDPHAPAVAQRIPFRPPRLERPRGDKK
jgi:formate-dependent nitrite reductase cytochrome c552 subunit